MKHGVEANDVEPTARQRTKVVSIADTEFEPRPHARSGKPDAQRQWVNAEHISRGTGEPGDMLRQQASAAPDVEHAFAGFNVEPFDQLLPSEKLALGADPIIVARELLAIERKRRPRGRTGVGTMRAFFHETVSSFRLRRCKRRPQSSAHHDVPLFRATTAWILQLV
jgi:hypothetical protein